MRNLIALTNVANKYYSDIPAGFILECGYNNTQKWCYFTDDKDCLPPDINHYRSVQFTDDKDFLAKIKAIESLDYKVIINTQIMNYETNTGQY